MVEGNGGRATPDFRSLNTRPMGSIEIKPLEVRPVTPMDNLQFTCGSPMKVNDEDRRRH